MEFSSELEILEYLLLLRILESAELRVLLDEGFSIPLSFLSDALLDFDMGVDSDLSKELCGFNLLLGEYSTS